MDRVPNAQTRELCGVAKGVDKRVDECVLWWFGRMERMENERFTNRVYVGECAGSCSVGMLKRWIDTMKDCLRKRGLDVRQARRMDSLEHVLEFKYSGYFLDESGTDRVECSRKLVSGRRVAGICSLKVLAACLKYCLYLFLCMAVRQCYERRRRDLELELYRWTTSEVC